MHNRRTRFHPYEFPDEPFPTLEKGVSTRGWWHVRGIDCKSQEEISSGVDGVRLGSFGKQPVPKEFRIRFAGPTWISAWRSFILMDYWCPVVARLYRLSLLQQSLWSAYTSIFMSIWTTVCIVYWRNVLNYNSVPRLIQFCSIYWQYWIQYWSFRIEQII